MPAIPEVKAMGCLALNVQPSELSSVISLMCACPASGVTATERRPEHILKVLLHLGKLRLREVTQLGRAWTGHTRVTVPSCVAPTWVLCWFPGMGLWSRVWEWIKDTPTSGPAEDQLIFLGSIPLEHSREEGGRGGRGPAPC